MSREQQMGMGGKTSSSSKSSSKGPPSEDRSRGGGQTTKEKQIAQKNITQGINQLRGSGVTAQDKVNLNQFINKPNTTNMPQIPGITGLALQVLQDPFRRGALQTRSFFANKVMPRQGINFASLDPSVQNKMYEDYMSQRLEGNVDAYGNPIMRGNEGIATLQPSVQPIINQQPVGINQIYPYYSNGVFNYAVPMGI